MKKIILIALGIIIIGGISLMVIKKEVMVSRSTTINAPLETVHQQVSHFKNFVKWNPWGEIDPKMKKEFSGEDGTIGAKYSWAGNDEVGTGTQEILEISKEKIKIKLIFSAPQAFESEVYYNLIEENGQTKVTWGYLGEMPLIASIFVDMDTVLGDKYEKGLISLKEICER